MESLTVMGIYKQLYTRFGDQKWWPADTPFEVMVGAILTQQTTWKNVEMSILNLKEKDLLSIKSLSSAPIKTIENCVRPSGFYKQKARRIKSLSAHLWKGYQGDLGRFFIRNKEDIRKELLSLEGVGPETADSILLYAGSKLKFVIDAYTFRIFKRLGMDFRNNYQDAQAFFEERLPEDLELYRNFHALIVELGKNFCRTKPICQDCPLSNTCKF